MAISILHYLLLQPLLILLFIAMASATTSYNVVSFGAKADGKTDSTKAFLAVWQKACGSAQPAAVYVPTGTYLVGKTFFEGPCKNNAITFTIDGTLVAPSTVVLGENWIVFHNVDGVWLRGGLLDGQGSSLWACKKSGKNCPGGATSLAFLNCKNVMVAGLTSHNSQLFHIVIHESQHVKLQGVKVVADENSPNTDGIHIEESNDVTVFGSNIRTGDDCISIGPGSSNVWLERIACGPGHGISIGSLGKDTNEDGVQNVTVKTVKFTGTENGVRIKTWGKPCNSFVRNVRFQHAAMFDVKNPIVIDQNYCPHGNGCSNQASGVKISDITYQEIHGTSATEVAVKFDCSSKNPCSGITLEDVNLTYNNNQNAQASCENAGGTTEGNVRPKSCLK